jgi:hypothetical protein
VTLPATNDLSLRLLAEEYRKTNQQKKKKLPIRGSNPGRDGENVES